LELKNNRKNYINRIKQHYASKWSEKYESLSWNKGPINELPIEFSVLEFSPFRKGRVWTYATCGMSNENDNNPLELHIFAPEQSEYMIELLYAIAHYHRTGKMLGLGHTVNFGRPWWRKSKCTYGLISLPYLDGPELEGSNINGIKVQFLWLIPITIEEVNFIKLNGVEALEQIFERNSLNYIDPLRNSMV
jgi:Suppressor of fused protein (SUFU)